jgi:NodT family efflux transporter outer membrane factor (OMF) lipoprotein
MLYCLTLLLTLAGCAVGPHYQPPPAPGAPWAGAADAAALDLTWWRSLHDEALDALITRAMRESFDLKAAEARLRQARASRDAVAGHRLPELDAAGSATRNGWSENGQIPVSHIPGFARDYNLFEVGFDASWEIDLWGHTQRQLEAANARATAANEARRDLALRLITEVARGYLDLRSAQQQLLSATADARARTETARLVKERALHGEASRFDSARAEAQAESARAALPGLDADAHAAAYRLAMLTGQAPEDVQSLLTAGPLPESPPQVAVGLRSDVLKRRPDVRQAELDLAAATADVGAATADLFPRLALLGSLGQQSQTAHQLGASSSTYFSVGPSLHWPVFAGGSLRASLRAARAGADLAAAQYQSVVHSALSDSETALNRYAAAQLARADRAAAREQSEQALKLAQQRYQAGEDDLLVLLDAQSAFSSAEQQDIAAQANTLTSMVALYKALGGGWQDFEPAMVLSN